MKHRAPTRPYTKQVARAAVLAGVATALVANPAVTHATEILHPAADPTPGNPTPGGPGGGDVTPGNPTPGTPEPAPPPAPESTPEYTPQPNYDGPTSIPGPPSTQSVPYVPPTYNTPYTPLLPIVQGPRPYVPPQPMVKPPPGTVRIGNLIIPRSQIPLADADIRSVNRWAAYTEAQIATGLIAAGVPRDEATRRAASTMIGVAIGGAAGAVIAGVPATLLAEIFLLPVGVVAGGVIGGIAAVPAAAALLPFIGPVSPGVAIPVGIGVGAVAGAGVATVAAVGIGALAAAGGAVVGGTLGGLLAYWLGAGDPGATPGTVRDPGSPESDPDYTLPQPNPGANQYQLVIGNSDSRLPGGPGARYVVKSNGAVEGSVTVNGMTVPFGWSAEQADAPFRALGFLSQTGRDSAQQWAYATGQDAVKRFGDILRISYPQSVKPGQTAPTDGTLGQAGLDRLRELQEAQNRAIRQQQNQGGGQDSGAPSGAQRASAPATTVSPPSAPAPTWVPPRVSIPPVPVSAPEPVKQVASQAQSLLNQGRAALAGALRPHR